MESSIIKMLGNKKVLGIVLARSGSKGLVGKNYKLLDGKPLVQYAIEAGTQSKYLDDVILSSDCDKCIEIANNLGINVPFKRPDYLSGDKVWSADVIIHALDYLEKHGNSYDFFVLLEPTSPLRNANDVDKALELIIEHKATSLVSVCQSEDQHPNFMFKEGKNKRIETWAGTRFKQLRRQDIDKAYFLDGSVYISEIQSFLSTRSFCHDNTIAYIVPKWKSYEIDDIWDFLCVEAILTYRKNNIGNRDEEKK